MIANFTNKAPQMKNTIIATLAVVFVGCSAYFGYAENIEWARNILKFYIWSIAVPMSVIVMLMSGLMTRSERNKAKNSSCPYFLAFIYNIMYLNVVCIMLINGDILSAIGLFLCTTASWIARKAITTT